MHRHLLFLLLGMMLVETGHSQSSLAILRPATPPDYRQGTQTSLIRALSELEKRYAVRFSYEHELLRDKTVAREQLADQTTQELNEVLDRMLRPLRLTYERFDEERYLILPQKTQNGLPRLDKQPIRATPRQQGSLPTVPPNTTRQRAMVEKTITGRVTDLSTDETLPGVNIVAKGTTVGTVTDIDGNYRLTVADEVETLVFSSVGYLKEEIAIGNQTVINLAMSPDIQSLSEVVVVGYGAVKKKDLTGSVSSIETSDIVESIPTPSLDQAIQGRAAGVFVREASGAPGAASSIRIRGVNSVNTDSEPLYVIDGMPVSGGAVNGGAARGGGTTVGANPLAAINTADIASIEILKDASATAIYGSRAANGVVLVTTKSGTVGQAAVNLNVSYGVQELLPTYQPLDAGQYANYVNTWRTSNGEEAYYSPEEVSAFETNGGFDWLDAITQAGETQNYQLSVSGGDGETQYLLSGGYFKNKGVVINSGFERYSIRANLDKTIGRFKVGTNLSFARTQNQVVPTDGSVGANGGSIISEALAAPPTQGPLEDDGSYRFSVLDGDNFTNNPLAVLNETSDELFENRLLGTAFAEYEITEGLTAKVLLGGDVNFRKRNIWYSKESGPNYGRGLGFGRIRNADNINWVNTNQLTYAKEFGVHRLNVTGVVELQQNTLRFSQLTGEDFPVGTFETDNLGVTSGLVPPVIESGGDRNQLLSYVGRINYTLLDRYLFTLTGRYDGSSRFTEDNRWGFFPSAAFAWRVSDEPFIRNVDLIDNLKFRASYGITGNQGIGNLRTASNLSTFPFNRPIFGGSSPIQVTGYTAANIANRGLVWEEARQFDIGIDVGILESRLSFTVDYFNRQTDNLLLDRVIPPNTGFNRITDNIGKIENRGIEISVQATPVNTENVTWNLQGNVSFIRNKVVSLGTNEELFAGNISADGGVSQFSLARVGEPLGVFYGLTQDGDGVVNTAEELEAYQEVYPNAILGMSKVADVNGDSTINADDRVILGDPNPDAVFGLSSSVRYRRVTLSFLLQGTVGNDILNLNRRTLYKSGGAQNKTVDRYENAWTPENPNALYPGIGTGFRGGGNFDGIVTDEIVEDGSYLRMKNITLSYELPVETVKLFESVRLYGTVQNLFTITDYKGFNPEVNSLGQSTLVQGVDLGGYPLARTYNIGVDIRF